MATAKKSKKSVKRLRKGSKLEEQKPLTKFDVPSETITLNFTKIATSYK
jgi:hypothetical protein